MTDTSRQQLLAAALAGADVSPNPLPDAARIELLKQIIWQLLKQQTGRMVLELTPPPAGHHVRLEPNPTNARSVILIAE